MNSTGFENAFAARFLFSNRFHCKSLRFRHSPATAVVSVPNAVRTTARTRSDFAAIYLFVFSNTYFTSYFNTSTPTPHSMISYHVFVFVFSSRKVFRLVRRVKHASHVYSRSVRRGVCCKTSDDARKVLNNYFEGGVNR